MSDEYTYPGSELALFWKADRWKRYLADQLVPFIRGRVLEVGAGLGSMTLALFPRAGEAWTCVEPDEAHIAALRESLASTPTILPRPVRIVQGFLSAVGEQERYDTILYIDVLEHIAEPRPELAAARSRLAPDGVIAVLAPAFQWAFSPYDKSIGHCRRYDRRSLRAVQPEGTTEQRLRYLDCLGLTLNLANRLLLRAGRAKPGQLAFWNRCIVPVSRKLDIVLGYRFGRSVLAIWRANT